MIRKIKPSEYLARYDAMGDGERRDYQRRVWEWLQGGGARLYEMTNRPMAKAQNIVQLSMRWTQDECQAFQEGARLMSALIDKADTWLPTQLYAKGAYRAVRQMVQVLFHAQDGTGVPKGKLNGTFVEVRRTADTVEYQFEEKREMVATGKQGGDAIAAQQTKMAAKEEPAVNTRKGTQAVAAASAPFGQGPSPSARGTSGERKPGGGSTTPGKACAAAVPVRPKHIDQYAHLLPVATQERAAEYGPLMRQLDEARENLRLVAMDPHASSQDRQRWAVAVKKLDERIGGIKKELDAEWAKLVEQGRVVVDDLGMAHVIEMRNEKGEMRNDAAAADGGDGIAENAKKAEAEKQAAKEKQRQIKALRCWLRDCRTSKENQKHLKHWREKYLELIALGGTGCVTDAVKEAAVFYGFDLDALEAEQK